MLVKLCAWACCHRWKLAGALLAAVLSSTSFLRSLSIEVANTEATDPLASSVHSLVRREAPQTRSSRHSRKDDEKSGADERTEEVLKVRGKLLFTRKVLTEGPQLHPGRANYDSSEVYFSVDKKFEAPAYILGWKPIVNKHRCPNGSEVELVHHMNILAKEDADIRWMFPETGQTVHFGPDKGGVNIVATYDRGASGYRLPQGYGIKFSPQFPQLVLEYHLLLPHCWNFKGKPVLERSGFDLYITRKKPRHLALLAGFTDESLHIVPNQGLVEQTSVLHPAKLAKFFLAPSGSAAVGSSSSSGDALVALAPGTDRVEILAIHLHTHDIARAKSFEILDKSGRSRFRSPTEPAGYGKTQSLMSPADKGWPRLRLETGESVHVKCKYDTNTFKQVLVDGTSWGEEMCSVLMVLTSAGLDARGSLSSTILSAWGGLFKRLGRELLRLVSP